MAMYSRPVPLELDPQRAVTVAGLDEHGDVGSPAVVGLEGVASEPHLGARARARTTFVQPTVAVVVPTIARLERSRVDMQFRVVAVRSLATSRPRRVPVAIPINAIFARRAGHLKQQPNASKQHQHARGSHRLPSQGSGVTITSEDVMRAFPAAAFLLQR